jgi:hypothetical protein
MATLSEADVIKVRKRFYQNFDFYSARALKVRSKDKKIVPFALNTVQERFHKEVEDQRRRTGRVRKIILKGRQQGFSTYVGGRLYWRCSQRSANKGMVIAHKADSTKALWEMYQRYHKLVPELLRPHTQYASGKQLSFDKLDAGIVVSTAGGDGVGRGEMFTDVHASELAFWPASTAEETLSGLLDCVPPSDDTEVYIESTANGYNEFYRIWNEAVQGRGDFEPFFAAWFESPEYRDRPPEGFERTIEEDELVALYGLDDAQLNWRRKKISDKGIDKFKQEYPCSPEEAFINSGRPVFNPDQLTELLEVAPQPIARMDFMPTAAGLVLEDNPAGRLLVYREKDAGETYCIGADVGIGVRDGDWSVAQVLDSQKRQVAVLRAQVDPHYFADILQALGTYYNMALIGPERNNHGLLTCVRLWKDLSYPNVFIEVREGQTEDNELTNIGHYTDVRTKPLIIDRLRAALRENDIELFDSETLHEMKVFIVTDTGKMEAEAKCHDDCVMSLAIANHIHPGRYTPITVSDEHYSYGI